MFAWLETAKWDVGVSGQVVVRGCKSVWLDKTFEEGGNAVLEMTLQSKVRTVNIKGTATSAATSLGSSPAYEKSSDI